MHLRSQMGRFVPASLRRTAPYVIAREILSGVRAGARRRRFSDVIVSFASPSRTRKRALLCYRIEPFLERGPMRYHGQYWVAVEMVRIFLELGYDVDVISQASQTFRPRAGYAVAVDVRNVLERIGAELGEGCLKIAHLDTAHILSHDAAEAARLLALRRRRGVALPPSRFEMPNFALEHADCATTFRNDAAVRTFRYAGKPIYELPIPSSVECSWPAGRDLAAARSRFLYLSSQGLAHKGLDLLLEAFAEMPDFYLTVCAPLEQDPQFVAAYRRELFELPNVDTVGWLDLSGPDYATVARSCAAAIMPSCSEGGSAVLVEAMHAGLVPVVTLPGSADDLHRFGFLLESASAETIKEAVYAVASTPVPELEDRARAGWEYVRAQHTRARFSEEYRRTIQALV